MKRKILILAPILALALSGCFARIPTTPTSGGGKSSGTTTTSGTSSGSSTGSTTEPGPAETYGTLDNPITVANARQIGLAIEGAASDNTVYETKDAYIKGIVLNAPEESSKTAGTYRFNIGEAYGATDYVQFYWGKVDDNVTLPVEGDEVVLFGRLANYHAGYMIELVERTSIGAQTPLVKKSSHLTVSITVTPSEHGEVTGAPQTAKTGDVVQLTATPETGYNVEYVKANGATLVENAGKYSFTVKTDTTITSSFVDQPVVKTSLQIAYEAAESLSNKTESADSYTFTGTVVGSAGNTHIIQDGEYGMMIYGGQTAYEAAVVGKKVEVKAKVKNFNGCIETGTITSVTAAGDGDTIEPVYVASMAELNAIKQNVLVNINKAVLVEKPSSWQDDTKTNRGKFTLGEDTTQVQVSFSGFAYNADNAQVLEDATVGDSLVFEKIYSTAFDSSGKVQTNQLALNKNSVLKSSTPVVTPTSVEITNTVKSVVKKQSLALTATVGPEGASQKVDWEVTPGTGTAHIDNGSLVGDSVGTVSVTATAHGTTVKSDPVEFSVTPILVTGFDLDPTELSFVEGSTDTQTIAVKNVLPEDADNKEVEWSTSDPAVVTVENGVVSLANTAHANDTATITATAKDGSGISKTCSVEVTQNIIHVGDVAIDPSSLTMKVGDEDAQLTAVFTNPDNPTDKTVSWSITGTDGVASVSADGKVHAIAEGTTEVTVTTTDGDKTATCAVTVNPAEPETYGTLDNPITVAQARTIAAALNNQTASTTVFETKDAYVRGVINSDVKASTKTAGTYQFYFGDELTSTNNINFYWGYIDSGVTVPIKGETVIAFGRLGDFYTGSSHTYELAGNSASSIADPIVKVVTPVTPEEIDLSSTDSTVGVGNTIQLKATILPTGARGSVIWSIQSGSTFATLSNDQLTGTATGTVVVKAILEGNSNISATKEITVTASQNPGFEFTRNGTSDTVSSGYQMVLTNYAAKDGYYQDGSGSVGLHIGVKKSSGTMWTTAPTSITLTVKVGGGSAKDPLTNNVTANLIDASGNAIAGTTVTVTTKVESKDGKEYEVSIPVAANAAGVMVHHDKETSYNVRVFSIKLTTVM